MNCPSAIFLTLSFTTALGVSNHSVTGPDGRSATILTITDPRAVLSKEQRAEAFDALHRFVQEHYCYFDEKATDWSAVRRRYRPMALAAHSREELIHLLERTLEELYDPHCHLNTHLGDSWRLPGWDIWAEWRDNRAMVVEVSSGSAAERAGIQPGQQILRVNGTPVAAVVAERLPRCLRRDDANARDWALRAALSGRRDQARVITLCDPDGKERDVRPDDLAAKASTASAEVSWQRLAEGPGYIRITHFGHERIVDQFDRALESLRDAPGLILDVRDNPGGDTAVARPIMGRFIQERRQYAWMARRQGKGLGNRWPEYVEPRGPWTYHGPVVVLVNHWSSSMPEGFAMGLDGVQRATVVGTRMAGLGAAIGRTQLPHLDIGVQISTEPVYHVNGTPRHQFLPPVVVDLTRPPTKPMPAADALLNEAVRELLRLIQASRQGLERGRLADQETASKISNATRESATIRGTCPAGWEPALPRILHRPQSDKEKR